MVILEIILENNSTQNYLVVQPKDRYFKRVAGVGSCECIYFWKYKGLSDERTISIAISIAALLHN